MRQMLYLAGAPGVGKTTLMRKMLGRPKAQRQDPVPHLVYPGGVQLGRERADFGGTDALSMSIQPKVVDWLAGPAAPSVVVGEGDRLANLRFMQAVRDLGYAVHLVILTAPEELLAERRQSRGSNQNPTWLKGRVSKVARLQREWDGAVVVPTDNLLRAQVVLRSHPVAGVVRQGVVPTGVLDQAVQAWEQMVQGLQAEVKEAVL